MMPLYVSSMKAGDFCVTPSLSGDSLRVRLSGTADSTILEPLAKLVTSIEAELARSEVSEIVIDIQDLYLLNSSCMKILAKFTYGAAERKSVRALRYVVSSRFAWQARAVLPMERIAPGLVTVEKF